MTVIEEYILSSPITHQEKLFEMYHLIKNIVPEAMEKISWQMPTFYLNGNLVHFAYAKHHIGLYPGASGVSNFEDELKDYKHSKGAIQFPLDKPLPHELIEKIVRFRVGENTQ